MKITTPADKGFDLSNFNNAVEMFEKKLKEEDNGSNYYHLVIVGELNRITCNAIEKVYEEAGWSKVVCKTSSEKYERPGLTGLQLWT